MADRGPTDRGCRGPLMKITCRSAKCDVCELKQRSKIYRCPDCAKQICEQCMSSPKASHRLPPSVESDVPPTPSSYQSPASTPFGQQPASRVTVTPTRPAQRRSRGSNKRQKTVPKTSVEYILEDPPIKRISGQPFFSGQLPNTILSAHQSSGEPSSSNQSKQESSALQNSMSSSMMFLGNGKKRPLLADTAKLDHGSRRQADSRATESQTHVRTTSLEQKGSGKARRVGRVSLRLINTNYSTKQRQSYWPPWPKRGEQVDEHETDSNVQEKPNQSLSCVQDGTKRPGETRVGTAGTGMFSRKGPRPETAASVMRDPDKFREKYRQAFLSDSVSSGTADVEQVALRLKRSSGAPSPESVGKSRAVRVHSNSTIPDMDNEDVRMEIEADQTAAQQPFVSGRTKELFESGSRYKWDGYGIDMLLAAASSKPEEETATAQPPQDSEN